MKVLLCLTLCSFVVYVCCDVLDRMSPYGARRSAVLATLGGTLGSSETASFSQVIGGDTFVPTRAIISTTLSAAVIGAGPAGLVAAIKLQLAGLGYRVVVFDKNTRGNRARFLGLFSREMKLLERLGFSREEITFYPEGKETKRGILSADLDEGLATVAQRVGVKVCRGYTVVGLDETSHFRPRLRVERSRRGHLVTTVTDATCEELRSLEFDKLIYAGGSRNAQLGKSVEEQDDFPAKFLRSPVIPLESFARRGLLYAMTRWSEISSPLKSQTYDDGETATALKELLQTTPRTLARDLLRAGVYDPWEVPLFDGFGDEKENREEIAGVFEDVQRFSPLQKDSEVYDEDGVTRMLFSEKLIKVLLAAPETHIRKGLDRAFFVSNVNPELWEGYKASYRKDLAKAQDRLVPDFLFLNLGVKNADGSLDLRRLHWEGPLPTQEYKKRKSELLTMAARMAARELDVDEKLKLANDFTFDIMSVLAKHMWATRIPTRVDLLSYAEYLEENSARSFSALRSASVFESHFAASAVTRGTLRSGKEFFIIGDAAQDAWYRFGLGVHDGVGAALFAVACITNEEHCSRLVDFRNQQALRALQITHALLAGQEAYVQRGDFGSQWIQEALARTLNRCDFLQPALARPS